MSPKLEPKPEDVACLRCGAPKKEHWRVPVVREGDLPPDVTPFLICPTAIFLPSKK